MNWFFNLVYYFAYCKQPYEDVDDDDMINVEYDELNIMPSSYYK